ncbi:MULTISPECIES: signal peptidase II [Luteococcus]|uniref:Lipoprotein signal peptidase n=2 Tax=Luteococcus japonicus TaxID=33984 RepID=A0A1R4KLS1_9ACTN|nr:MULTISPECIES: signal peptidase II [Luteococcus]MDN5562936.1 signal peptidase II [Luteococcus sp.]SJN45321.1 Lipoprotein signal peptidase [Luteococcus japonicus LSP_Lj1]
MEQTDLRRRARWTMLVVVLMGLVLDQLTKYLAVEHLDPQRPVRVLGQWLQLHLIRNPGAAFSLGDQATAVISVLAVVASLVMFLVVLPRVRTVASGILAGMATAGIVGNLVDRLFRPPSPMRGHVVDFLQVPHFAIFNVADIFITMTAAILLLEAFRGGADQEDQ